MRPKSSQYSFLKSVRKTNIQISSLETVVDVDQEKPGLNSVRKDLLAHNLSDVNPLDREIWRTRIRRSLALPTPEPGARDTLNTKTGW